MASLDKPTNLRELSDRDVLRSCTVLVTVIVMAVLCWFALPIIQWVIFPAAAGGDRGPWVIRPDVGARFLGTGVLTILTAMVIIIPLRRMWDREDRKLGTRYAPYHNQPAMRFLFGIVIVKASLLSLIFTFALAFYLFSWTIIEPEGIKERLFWETTNHTFDEIRSLEIVSQGQRTTSTGLDGPEYVIKFKDGHELTLSLANEGMSTQELKVLSNVLAKRSGREWKSRVEVGSR
jgi:hypothetical protein